jgi:hypothetical protein
MATRHLVLAIVAIVVALAAVVAFLVYRSTLERPDERDNRMTRNAPDRLSVRQIMVRHPAPEGGGMVWSAIGVPVTAGGMTALGSIVVSAWGDRVAEACGASGKERLSHFFYDERRVAYIDFSPAFLSGCAVGTSGEMELIESLEQTVWANLPGTAGIVLLSGGTPVDAPWRHVDARSGRMPP